MLRILNNIWIERLVRWIVGITFIYASLHKISAPAEFAKIIYGYGLFPHDFINLIAIILPFVELVTGLCLVFGIYTEAAAMIVGLMLAVFSLAISVNLARGYEFDCGCFSFDSHNSRFDTIFLLVRDLILLALCGFLLCYKGITPLRSTANE